MEKINAIKIGGYGDEADSFSRFNFYVTVGFAIPYTKAEEDKGVELAENAKSAILIERDTGTVLYDKNADERLSPASMTKIMTLLLNHGSDRKR